MKSASQGLYSSGTFLLGIGIERAVPGHSTPAWALIVGGFVLIVIAIALMVRRLK